MGELVLGLKTVDVDSRPPRQALVVEGLSDGQTTLELIKSLKGAGEFELNYWHPEKTDLPDVKERFRIVCDRILKPSIGKHLNKNQPPSYTCEGESNKPRLEKPYWSLAIALKSVVLG